MNLKALDRKKISMIALCVVLALIPTIAAILVYHYSVDHPVTERSVQKLELTDPDGNLFVFEKGKTTECAYGELLDGTISFFMSLHSHAEPTASLPSSLASTQPFSAVYYSYNLQSLYQYYFTTDSSGAYYVDTQKNVYHIAQDDAAVFINSMYALALYKDAQAPVMTLGTEGTVVLPYSMSWRYRLTDNQYAKAVAETSEEKRTVTVAGLPQLQFSREPNYLLVQVYRDSELLFNDLYANLTADNVDFGDNNETLTVTVTAQWYQNEDYGSYGEACYNFIMDVRAPSAFYLGETTVDSGDFVVISGKNVADPSAITFRSDPAMDFTPVFFKEDDYVYALVPFSYKITSDTTYTFTLGYDGVDTTLTLNVKGKSFRNQTCTIDSNVIVSTRTQTTLDAFAEKMAPIFANQIAQRAWKDNTSFTAPVGNNQIKTGFGLNITIQASAVTYRHDGINYVVADGTTVHAACGGQVVLAETLSLTGRTVVIDHGFGLKTIYCHMSSLNVTAGDIVSAGDQIGVVGSTGFIDGTGFHFGMYVFNVPVSPYDALDASGIIVAKP